MRVALDTNILAYAEGINGAKHPDAALDLVHRLPQEATVIPVQVLGELFNVLVRKAGKPRSPCGHNAARSFPSLKFSRSVILSLHAAGAPAPSKGRRTGPCSRPIVTWLTP